MDIADWFDVENVKHLAAFRELNTSGAWPAGFIPAHVERGQGWHNRVTTKIADAWINAKLSRNGL